jgi:hypothetical protein
VVIRLAEDVNQPAKTGEDVYVHPYEDVLFNFWHPCSICHALFPPAASDITSSSFGSSVLNLVEQAWPAQTGSGSFGQLLLTDSRQVEFYDMVKSNLVNAGVTTYPNVSAFVNSQDFGEQQQASSNIRNIHRYQRVTTTHFAHY